MEELPSFDDYPPMIGKSLTLKWGASEITTTHLSTFRGRVSVGVYHGGVLLEVHPISKLTPISSVRPLDEILFEALLGVNLDDWPVWWKIATARNLAMRLLIDIAHLRYAKTLLEKL